MKPVTILDYGAGNLTSVRLACQRFGAAVSAIKCRGLSGRPPSAPMRAEVEAFLAAR